MTTPPKPPRNPIPRERLLLAWNEGARAFVPVDIHELIKPAVRETLHDVAEEIAKLQRMQGSTCKCEQWNTSLQRAIAVVNRKLNRLIEE